jgi:predicted nucleic acid-binding protein
MSGAEPLLLDSVVLIDHFNGVDAATRYLRAVHDRAHVSAITRAEVLAGFDPAGAVVVRRLLDRLRLVVIDGAVADLAAELRWHHRWRLPDALQAAAACIHSMKLVTRNTKHFNPAKHPFVLVPYTP